MDKEGVTKSTDQPVAAGVAEDEGAVVSGLGGDVALVLDPVPVGRQQALQRVPRHHGPQEERRPRDLLEPLPRGLQHLDQPGGN